MTAPATLAEIERTGGSYPTRVVKKCETALVLFCAGFYGANDAAWLARTKIRATCVDTDREKIEAMRRVYPDAWEFIVCDAFYLELCASLAGRTWDVVSVDPWTNEMQRCADYLPFWCGIANRAVMIGTQADTRVVPPPGWMATEVLHRTNYDGGVYWTVLEPQ